MKHSIRIGAIVFTLTVSGCGGSAGTPAAPSSGPRTSTFTGSARTSDNGGCAAIGPSHIVDAGAGTLTVTLTQAGAPRMQLQVCATTEADHRNCTIPPFVLLSVGQSATGTVKGGRAQVVTLFPEGCGGPGAMPTDPVTYSVSVVHPG